MDLRVLGGGAIGALYAARCQQAAAEQDQVTLISRRGDKGHSQRIPIRVEVHDDSTATSTHDVRAMHPTVDDEGPADVIVVAVKAHETMECILPIRHAIDERTAVVTLQNGFNIVEDIRKAVPSSRIFQGATTFAVQALAHWSVRLMATGTTWLPDELTSDIPTFSNWLERAGLNPHGIASVDEVMWRKTATGTISLVAIACAKPAGILLSSSDARALARAATEEILGLARVVGVSLDDEKVYDSQSETWEKLPPNTRSSIYSDYLNGHDTEIDERFGRLLDIAQQNDYEMPVANTLYVMGKEQIRTRQDA